MDACRCGTHAGDASVKLSLVDNWRDVWKHGSSLCMSLFLAGVGAFNMLPERMQDAFSSGEIKIMAATLISVGLIAKFFKVDHHGDTDNHA